jgi:hypothetical protein
MVMERTHNHEGKHEVGSVELHDGGRIVEVVIEDVGSIWVIVVGSVVLRQLRAVD